uniref:Uncharacterized protein n=1 Tax=Rheinheimera sp. BAL341 TaxID=1708203 RepID=A0A486XQQ0_9GAMM
MPPIKPIVFIMLLMQQTSLPVNLRLSPARMRCLAARQDST